MNARASSLLAVRVQDGLHGLSVDEQGVRLAYQRDSVRNTLHFSLNGLVGDHAYGSFNQDAQGNLKGSVVIVAPLSGLPTPAGLSQVDTWFRMDSRAAQSAESGGPAVERSLGVGHAIVVAPENTEIPEGVQAIFYRGGVAERDRAVDEAFEKFGVERKIIPAMRSWPGFSEGDAQSWAEKTAEDLYPGKTSFIHCGMHDSSPDAELERFDSRGLIESLRHGRFSESGGGADIKLSEMAKARAEEGCEAIDAFLSRQPEEEASRLKAHCEWQKGRLGEDALLAQGMDAEWAAKGQAKFKREMILAAAEGLAKLPGQGDFFVARAGASQSTAFGAQTLAEALASETIGANDQIWRAGMAAGWASVAHSPVGGLAKALGLLQPAPAAPPSLPSSMPAQAPPPLAKADIGVGRLGSGSLGAWREARDQATQATPSTERAPARALGM